MKVLTLKSYGVTRGPSVQTPNEQGAPCVLECRSINAPARTVRLTGLLIVTSGTRLAGYHRPECWPVPGLRMQAATLNKGSYASLLVPLLALRIKALF